MSVAAIIKVRKYMKKYALLASFIVGAVPCGSLCAQDLSVDFTATVQETTCQMSLSALSGSSIVNTSTDQYEMTLPAMGISAVINESAESEGHFKLLPTKCDDTLTGLTMTMTGTLVNNSTYLIANDETNGAQNVGLALKRMGSSTLLSFDGSTPIDWSQQERTSGLDLTAAIRKTSSSDAVTAGKFKAKVIFTFNYH